MSIEPTYTERGLKRWPEIAGPFGQRISVNESSVADAPHLWLEIQNDFGNAGAHLSLDQAAQLRDTLDAAISHHYQTER